MYVQSPQPVDVSAIDVRVFRFDPQTGAAPRYATYSVPSATALTALEVLDYIYVHLDRNLAYRPYYCLKGVCLACLVRIDGKGAKGCELLLEPGRTYTIDPIHGYPVIRDLAVDFGTEFGAHEAEGVVVARGGVVLLAKPVAGPREAGDG